MHKYKYTTIDPITRIEGHLGIEVLIDNGIAKEAHASGTLFRGFEIILQGRDPRDASRLTQRVCGVCPTAHATASALCLDDAFGITDKIPENANFIRSLIFGCNLLQSHILHFYHLAALDYVDATKATGEIHPFTPRYQGDYRLSEDINNQALKHYIMALDIRRKVHEMLTIFGGKMPHNVGIIAGGVTERPTEDKIANFLARLKEIIDFIDNIYIADVLAVARAYGDYFQIGKGCGNFLAYGGFATAGGKLFKSGITSDGQKADSFKQQNITEDVKHSWYRDESSGKNPKQGETKTHPEKETGYSFIKAPRYEGRVYELGPLARTVVSFAQDDGKTKKMLQPILSEFKVGVESLFSVLGRHAARALECKLISENMLQWLNGLEPDGPISCEYEIPQEAQGSGLSEAPRGSLGHWISIKDKKIQRYQIITPTAWNGSPKDDKDQSGPIEQAIIGTKIKDEKNPFEVVRIIRSFDPCLACAVHLINAKGKRLGEFEVV
ncbi:MAG: nickel-dependent hydrogenase large subunit [Candidatus Omnitrophica bacterium]|nr:nickel-dependent hydrogenase large subunit [Candidatus Omnitrophota bacterium]